MPTDKKVTYASFLCDHHPLKDEQWRIRLVVSGNKLHYDHDVNSPTTDIVENKIIFNSTISDALAGARFAALDLKYIFLHTEMKESEYMKVNYKYFPEDIIRNYNPVDKVHNGYIYMKIKKDVYDLKQAALLAYNTVSNLLVNAEYEPILGSLGLW